MGGRARSSKEFAHGSNLPARQALYSGTAGRAGQLLFGKIKIWGKIVEHEAGYRSEFGKIISLDYGPPELLDKFRKIYGLNLARGTAEPS
jgi:hypothetical protein